MKEWDSIISENKPAGYFRRNLFLPLLIISSVSAFMGSFLFTNTELSNLYSVLTGIRYFVLLYLVIYGTALIFNEIMGLSGTGKDLDKSFKIVACSTVPFFLCQIISQLFESFIFVDILAFYGLYILWTGIEKMFNPPERKTLYLMISTVCVFIALYFLTSWLLTLAVDKLYFSLFV